MMQTPLSSNRRYLSVFFIVATILLLLATVHITREGVPEVIKSTTGWNNAAPPTSQGHTSASAPYASGNRHDNRPTFADLAKDSGTDKVTTHNYAVLYDKYLPTFRDHPVKMLEIGLGCGMAYGPGASYHTWIKYFDNLELNIMEYDEACGKAWAAKHPKANLYFGDQASPPFLQQTGNEVTADRLLDIIIDDGGHTMNQQETSLRELWKFVRPGGMYIAEDLHTSYLASYQGDPTRVDHATRTFMRFIYELIDDFMSAPAFGDGVNQKYPFSHEIQSIDCMEAMCVLIKKEVGAR
ncbi:hard-surface induced protein [Colletotrichum truncatum]|uniref:Hard-surface induced protein n=1 Tax=Colletotrichum truncatum TaxID=5467 RepID=A0ACC3YS19_COLTU|nr:hard-surface induced protein [Colletotrichum truncatum]KAF6789894.1 hard-surface induced protein [Colletotrichum truncatum]